MEGIADIEIGDTIMDLENPAPMERVKAASCSGGNSAAANGVAPWLVLHCAL